MPNRFLSEVLAVGEFPLAAQRVFADDSALLPCLAGNRALDDGLVFGLVSRRPRLPVDVTADLLSRRLPSDTQHAVVSSETRVDPLLSFLGHNEDCLAPGVVDALLSKVSNETVLSRLVQVPSLTPVQRRAAAMRAGGLCLLEFLLGDAYGTCAVSLPDLVGLLSTVESWRNRGQHARYRLLLSALLHARPEAVAPLVACFDTGRVPDTLLTPLSGCRFLTGPAEQRVVAGLLPDGSFVGDLGLLRYGLLSLAYNPVCSSEVLAELGALRDADGSHRSDFLTDPLAFRASTTRPRPTVSVGYESVDETGLAWLVPRACARSGRLWDVPALLDNRLLTKAQAQSLLDTVVSPYSGAEGLFSADRLQGLLSRFVERFPKLADQVDAVRTRWERNAELRRPASGSSAASVVFEQLAALRRDPDLRAAVSGASVPFAPHELSAPCLSDDALGLGDAALYSTVRAGSLLCSLSYAAPLAVFADLLVEAAGDSVAAWSFVVAHTDSWPGTVRELCEFVALMAQPDA